MTHTAIIDIGKTHSKLAVITPIKTGYERVFSDTSESRVDRIGAYPSLDVAGTWSWLLSTLKSCGHAGQISRCVVVTHGAAFALLAGTDLALPVMDYEFDGFGDTDPLYDALRGEFAETYSPRLPCGLNAGRQIFWQQQSAPDQFSSVTGIVPYPQYWAARLCGVVATEVTSLGSHTDLWRPAENRFSSLVESQGWLDRMPPPRAAWEVLGTVLPNIARASGLNPKCEILCGIHDSNASFLRHRHAEGATSAIVSTGTWVVCMAPGRDLTTLDAARDMLANVDVLSCPVPCARFMGGREYAIMTQAVAADGSATIADAERVMKDELFALPTFCAGVGPFPERSSSFPASIDRPGEVRALASLYCALMTDICLDALGVIGDVVLEGRFVDDPVYVEALAHFRQGAQIRISADQTGTIDGAARLLNWPESSPTAPVEYRPTQSAKNFRCYRRAWRCALTA